MTSLETFATSHNALTGAPLAYTTAQGTQIQADVYSWMMWDSVSLSCWRSLTGPLPLEWSTWAGLTMLNASANRLTGVILPQPSLALSAFNTPEGSCVLLWSGIIRTSYHIAYFVFQSRHRACLTIVRTVTGTLPQSWSALRQLATIDLSSNQISGQHVLSINGRPLSERSDCFAHIQGVFICEADNMQVFPILLILQVSSQTNGAWQEIPPSA